MKSTHEKYNSKNLLSTLKNILLVLLGTASIAFGTAVFMIPFDLVAGGMTGLAIVIDKLIPIELVTVDLIITVLTWAFFFLGLILLGRSFALKTLISTITYPPLVSLFMHLADPDVLGGYFYLAGNGHSEIAFVLAAIVGGALVGFGCATAFLGGGSTGGVDILALLISKWVPKLRSSLSMFILDTTVIVLGIFIIQDIVTSMLGIVSALVSAILIEKVFIGGNKAFIAHIVSDKYAQINSRIIKEVERTSTVVTVTGGYSGEEKRMLIVSFTMRQYHDVLGIITAEDKNAFVTVHRAHEINGEGWTR